MRLNVAYFLKYIVVAATNPLAFVAYVLVVVAWAILYFRVKRNNNLLNRLRLIPSAQRADLLRDEMGIEVPRKGFTGEQALRAQIHKYKFVAFLVFCGLVLCLAAIGTYSANLGNKNRGASSEPSTSAHFAGTVIDSLTGEPVTGAVVEIFSDGNPATKTDSNGFFDLIFAGGDENRKKISVEKDGYEEYREDALPSSQLSISLHRKGR